MWAPHHQHRLWAGVSRAVRTPSRVEQDFSLLNSVIPSQPVPFPPFSIPLPVITQGSLDYRSEEVISYEAGYRTTFSKSASLDVTGFYNDYRDLRYAVPGAINFISGPINLKGPYVPIVFTNALKGKTYGVEVATMWQMLDWWRWDFNYSWLHTQINDGYPIQTSISPQQRFSLRGLLTPWRDIDMDF